MWQVEWVPRARLPEDRTLDPRVGREHQVAERVDEGPLVIDGLVQQSGVEIPGAGHSAVPQPLDEVPRLAEPAGR
jgi:hypothetical protein